MSLKIPAVAVLLIAAASPAQAADWQYCLAASQVGQTVFISLPFRSRGDPRDADAAFAAVLDARGLPHDNVQCPRADDERVIVAMRQYAVQVNHRNGNAIVALPLEK